MSTLDYRLDMDGGGKNADAVALDCSDQVHAKVKAPTTADVTSGIIAALDAVVRSAGMDASRITHAMLGTTHATNAVLERRKLLQVALAEASDEARDHALAAGTDLGSVQIIELEEIPLAYLASPAVPNPGQGGRDPPRSRGPAFSQADGK